MQEEKLSSHIKKTRTDTAEMKYKAYTNKLTSVLQNCDQNYYIELLEQEKKT